MNRLFALLSFAAAVALVTACAPYPRQTSVTTYGLGGEGKEGDYALVKRVTNAKGEMVEVFAPRPSFGVETCGGPQNLHYEITKPDGTKILLRYVVPPPYGYNRGYGSRRPYTSSWMAHYGCPW